ncbi:MAG TPA: hypothetical protein VN636_17915 [Acidimicrobiia bacterium]|nr:hypothetical protein [Acidimicrobiia bacterium]
MLDPFAYVIDTRDFGHRVRNLGDGPTPVVRRISVGDVSAIDLTLREAALEFLDGGAMADPLSEVEGHRRPADQRPVQIDCDNRPLR